MKNSKLYIIATPIGNLEDITYRGVRILKEVDVILCEDTRITKRLLTKYNIKTKTLSYHANSGVAKVEKIFKLLKDGRDLALVSDAGTPTISDPGVLLIKQIHEEFGNEVSIIPIPGASALVSALSASGISSAQFTFLGFLPHKKRRETLFREIGDSKRTVVFFESPHRMEKTLIALSNVLGENRQVVIARELTKIHEEFVRGSISKVKKYFTQNQDKIKGEFVVIVGAC